MNTCLESHPSLFPSLREFIVCSVTGYFYTVTIDVDVENGGSRFPTIPLVFKLPFQWIYREQSGHFPTVQHWHAAEGKDYLT